MKMIDVSYHNGNTNFDRVKSSGIDGVIIRAGYGLNTVDKKFKDNIIKASAAGLHIGIYWFSYAFNTTQALAEARKCVATISIYKKYIDLPVFFDWEYDSMRYTKQHKVNPTKDLITSMCQVFDHEIEANGYRSGVYLNEDYRKNYIDLKKLPDAAIWYARYDYTGKLPVNAMLWQYTSKGKISGVSGNVDINQFYGNIEQIPTKSNQQIAIEVINGLWGNGITRKQKLTNAGYDYKEIQKIVNSILK